MLAHLPDGATAARRLLNANEHERALRMINRASTLAPSLDGIVETRKKITNALAITRILVGQKANDFYK